MNNALTTNGLSGFGSSRGSLARALVPRCSSLADCLSELGSSVSDGTGNKHDFNTVPVSEVKVHCLLYLLHTHRLFSGSQPLPQVSGYCAALVPD